MSRRSRRPCCRREPRRARWPAPTRTSGRLLRRRTSSATRSTSRRRGRAPARARRTLLEVGPTGRKQENDVHGAARQRLDPDPGREHPQRRPEALRGTDERDRVPLLNAELLRQRSGRITRRHGVSPRTLPYLRPATSASCSKPRKRPRRAVSGRSFRHASRRRRSKRCRPGPRRPLAVRTIDGRRSSLASRARVTNPRR
jgi:hypothetical protein